MVRAVCSSALGSESFGFDCAALVKVWRMSHTGSPMCWWDLPTCLHAARAGAVVVQTLAQGQVSGQLKAGV